MEKDENIYTLVPLSPRQIMEIKKSKSMKKNVQKTYGNTLAFIQNKVTLIMLMILLLHEKTYFNIDDLKLIKLFYKNLSFMKF